MSTGRDSSSSTNDDHGDGESIQDDTISSTEYALRCREFLEFLKDLNNLGTDKYFDMPRITVIGGQSAGKSSLVEAVSGIHVPRDSGTCTRCPMECSMSSNADAWSCQITLRCSVDTNGCNLATPTRALFGPLITDKESVELWLRRAQVAILSPHMEHNEFYRKTLEELQEAMRTDQNVLRFSKNVIHVEVKDPELTDLSFIDLPGLIQNSDADVINLVRELVESHIGGQNTLILVTIPMSDDIENQQAVRLAKEADPFGERTIGVLTKPDTLPPGASGSRRRWMSIIEGHQHPLKHGYYCVRLPDDDERARNISRTESTRVAAEFFNSTPPWNTIASRNRFGVRNLVSDLSLILVGLIEKNLPALKQTIDEQLRACHVELGKLPAPLATDPSTEFLLRVTKFCADFRAAVFGEARKTLVQHNRRQYDRLKFDIYRTCPDFRPFEDYPQYHNPVPLPLEEGHAKYAGPPLGLKEVQKVIDDSIGWELPDYVPFDATKELIMRFTAQWKEPSHACFERVFDGSSQFVDELIQDNFGRFKLLDAYISSVVRIELDKIKASALHMVDKTLQLEHNPVYTLNTDYFASEKHKWSLLYAGIRRRPWRYLINDDPSPSEASESDNGADQIMKFSDDKFQQALSVMANVRAYFQVTYKRIIDHIPLIIEHELHQTALTNFETSLFESLPRGHDALERTKALLCEDPIIGRKRSSLESKKELLTQIKVRLDEFHRKVDRTLGP